MFDAACRQGEWFEYYEYIPTYADDVRNADPMKTMKGIRMDFKLKRRQNRGAGHVFRISGEMTMDDFYANFAAGPCRRKSM
jgi:hypothetical protein